VLLNAAGRQLLAGLCGASEGVLARTLPSWGQEDAKLPAGEDQVPAAAWRIGGAVAGSAAFGCRLCAARRTGTAERVVRYTPRRERVCGTRRDASGCMSGTVGGSWTRTPTSPWSIWTYRNCRTWSTSFVPSHWPRARRPTPAGLRQRRLLIPVRMPGQAGRAYRAADHLTLDGATIGTRTWEAFLAERIHIPCW
jgi:hypothetical protein